jgi:Zn-finger nucleic acid-binding protein
MSDRQGIEIDYCPQCRGVWLDRGELDKIIERANEQMVKSSRRNDDWDDDDDDDRKFKRAPYPPKKKKMSSMLGDMFDFG